MSISAVGNNSAIYAMMMAQDTGKTGVGETKEMPAQERSETPQVQAAEGEKGGTINTYA